MHRNAFRFGGFWALILASLAIFFRSKAVCFRTKRFTELNWRLAVDGAVSPITAYQCSATLSQREIRLFSHFIAAKRASAWRALVATVMAGTADLTIKSP